MRHPLGENGPGRKTWDVDVVGPSRIRPRTGAASRRRVWRIHSPAASYIHEIPFLLVSGKDGAEGCGNFMTLYD